MACQKVEENVARARAFARALEWLPDSVHRRNEISRQIDNRDYQTDNQHSHINLPGSKDPQRFKHALCQTGNCVL